MGSEKQYIDLYGSGRDALFSHSAAALNAVRDKAFDDSGVSVSPHARWRNTNTRIWTRFSVRTMVSTSIVWTFR